MQGAVHRSPMANLKAVKTDRDQTSCELHPNLCALPTAKSAPNSPGGTSIVIASRSAAKIVDVPCPFNRLIMSPVLPRTLPSVVGYW